MQPIDRARFFTSFRMTTLAFSCLRHSLLIKGFNLQKTRSNRDLNSHPNRNRFTRDTARDLIPLSMSNQNSFHDLGRSTKCNRRLMSDLR